METSLVQHVSNALSLLTILSCLFLKVPQIAYIREKQSAEGIYIQALLMEIIGYSITTLYNFTNQYSLMTYLEYPIILLQVYVLLYYVLKYKNMLSLPVVPMASGIYAMSVVGFAMGCLPKGILSFLLPFCTPLSNFAKVTYIYGIFKAQNADAVSITTWIISVSTNLSRIFTVYVDSADTKLMLNFIISMTLSSGVLISALYFKNKTASPKQSKSADSKQNNHHDHSD